jgi:hypothetical protein
MSFLENIKLKLGLGWKKEITVKRATVKIEEGECIYDQERGKRVCHPKTKKTNQKFV